MDKQADDLKPEAQTEHHENLIERVAENLESRFLAAAEVATETTSAETNLAMAALTAIEGPPAESEVEKGTAPKKDEKVDPAPPPA